MCKNSKWQSSEDRKYVCDFNTHELVHLARPHSFRLPKCTASACTSQVLHKAITSCYIMYLINNVTYRLKCAKHFIAVK